MRQTLTETINKLDSVAENFLVGSGTMRDLRLQLLEIWFTALIYSGKVLAKDKTRFRISKLNIE